MLKSIDANTVNKLRQLISTRYGKAVEIRQLSNLSGSLSDLSNTESYLKGSSLYVPICCNGARLGTAVIPDALDLNEEKSTGIAQVVRMVLEPTMYNWYLERKEANLAEITKATNEIHRPLAESVTDDEDSFEEWTPDQEDLVPQLLSNLVHLIGTNENLVKKVALQLHEMTHRWAFVPWSDVKSEINTVDDLLKMGAMTLFIKQVELLTVQEQELLINYLGQQHTDEHPLIITASGLAAIEMESLASIAPILIDELSVNSFEVDRAPLSFQSLKEVLELFFFRTDRELDS